MKNKRLSKLKSKKYLAGVLLVLVVGVLACLLKFGNLDKLKGTIKVTDAYLSNVTTKLSANISDISGDAPVVSNGYDEVKYELKYRLSASNQDRDVIITGTLDSDNGYASFKRLYGDNVTSTLSDNDRKIEITIRNLPADTEITTVIPIVVNGAPDGYRVNPTFKIKESTAEEFTDVYTNPIQVSTNDLRGTVTDVEGNRVPNILVTVYKNKKLIRETYTNDNGEYIISDLNQDNYTIDINEEIYDVVNVSNVSVSGDTSLDITVSRVYPFNIEVHKYITKVDVNNLGITTVKTYDNASIVNFPVKRLNNLNGKVYYKIVVENTGEKEGIVSIVKDELPDFMAFIEDENSGFELVDGVIYDRNLEGIELMPGERVEDSLVLTIKNTSQAREYLNRVTATGEIYEHVVYLLDGNTYREEDVLEGEKLDRIADPVANFGGWYTDPEYTNKYNYNNRVTKNLILYGKTTRKYRVEFFDKDPETGDEDPYKEDEVPAGDPVDEPDDHPEHPGYDFEYWCMVDGTKYIFSTPVTEDLKLVTCYKIKKYDVNFYNYQDTKEKTIKVEYKKLIDQNEAPTFDETGYTFICWTEDKDNCFDFTTPVTREVNLYPKHEKLKNAVVFNDENRITTVDNIPYGDTVDPIADQGKEGHTFRCWSEDRTNCFNFNTPIIETKTLYAIYDINTYLVHFIDRNPETLVETQYIPDQTVEWGGFATRPVNNPEHTGYTFVEWTKDNTTYSFDTPVKSEITLVSSYRINSYPVHFHADSEVTTVNVEYKHTVTPITDPEKEHHIFTKWLDENDEPFIFTTPIVEETDLYAEFEEILPPVISHTPTMWTNEDVTATLTKNANVLDDTGYTYSYKLANGTYNTYSAPFAVSENTTITAKGTKSGVDSVVTNHEIVNIDKLNPSITLFSLNTVNRNSAVLNVNTIDNESGINYYEVYKDNVKIGEKHFECYNETTFDEYEACRANYAEQKVTTYTVTGLTQTTTYTFKIKAYDKAGNYVFSDDLEVTTTTPRIVARLIGYNNSLFTDTVDENTGDVITPKEDKYINFESLEEAFDYEDLYDCKNVQCTIQMVTSTNESVQVLEGQNLTLDLNGKIVSGIIPEYTIKNNGDFTLIESTVEGEDPGKLINNQGIAILNKAESHLTLGEGYSDVKVNNSFVSTTRPYVYGEINGVKNETNGYFTLFDGKIVAPQSQTPGYGAVNGKVTGTEYSYEAVSNGEIISGNNYQAVTLNILTSPEARINNSVYYSRLASAMDDANRGTTTIYTGSTPTNLMQSVESKGAFTFEYDDVTGTLVSHSGTKDSEKTDSYLVIDLTNETNNKVLSIDYTPSYTEEYYNNDNNIQITRYLTGVWSGSEIFSVNECLDYSKKILGNSVSPYRHDLENYSFELEKGKMYYLDMRYYKYSNNSSYQYLDELTINNITISDLDKNTNNFNVQSNVSVSNYGFYYDESDGSIRSSNQYVAETSSAYGIIEIDLTEYEDRYYDVELTYVMQSYYERYNSNETALSYAKIYIGEDKQPTSGSWLGDSYGSGYSIRRNKEGLDVDGTSFGGWETYGPITRTTSLYGGKKYYLKLSYEKMVKNPDMYPTREEYEAAGNLDQLIITSVDIHRRGDTYILKNSTDTVPVEGYTVMEDVLSSSNGGFVQNQDGTISTNFTAPNQRVEAKATIDLTNDSKGAALKVIMDDEEGVSSNGYSYDLDYMYTRGYNVYDYFHYNESFHNHLAVRQKRTVDGVEKMYVIEPSDGYYCDNNGSNCKSGYVYNLQGGFEYEVSVGVQSPDAALATYPKLTFTAFELTKPKNYLGNYFNSPGASNNLLGLPSTEYRDSFIKIDLTDKEYDQELYISGSTGSYVQNRIYLTDNNRALTKEELEKNRIHTLATNAYGKYILEKGRVYYLHFAGIGYDMKYGLDDYVSSYINNYTWGISEGVYLAPALEHVYSLGSYTVFTGTYDVAGEREESTYIPKKVTDEPVFVDNGAVYGFEYNEETGMYDSLNTNRSEVAVKVFKLDLTDATSDRTYAFVTNGGGARNIYTISEDENIEPLSVSTYIELFDDWKYTMPAEYSKIDDKPTFNLQKGKVYYLQVVTYNPDDSTLSFKLDEMNTSNSTSETNPINEIREFNEHVDTVQLLRTVSTTAAIDVDYSEEVVLDLNGYDLSTSDDYVINNYGKLTLVDTKYQRKLETYDSDLAEYQEYAGLCDGCEPSEEYKLDHIMDYLDEFGIDLSNVDQSSITDFDYTGSVQTYVVPESGLYKLEVWGAQGGYRSDSSRGGKGGYSTGILELEQGETVYVYVGGSGNTGGTAGGFNGGGARDTYNGGGGATDIRVEGDSLFNRIIVAGGGGSDGNSSYGGGVGGGNVGYAASQSGYGSGGSGGTQTSPGEGGSFGQGGYGQNKNGGYGGAGGGGWFGGGATTPDGSGDDENGGGGGSGFVYLDPTNSPVGGYLVENHYILTGSTTAGSDYMIAPDGTYQYGNGGDGYARISLVAGEEYTQLRENLPKTYNIKKEPSLEGMSQLSNGSGTGIISNKENAYLTLRDVKLDVTSKYGIYNEGTITTESSPIININALDSYGIYNIGGDIVNNGNLKLKLNYAYCSTDKEFGAVAIAYRTGTHDLTNVTIEGRAGTGIIVYPNTEVNLHSSNINMNEYLYSDYDCLYAEFMNNHDRTNNVNSDLYNKIYDFKTKFAKKVYSYYSSEYFNRYDGSIYNRGTFRVDEGSSVVGQIGNFGTSYITDGTSFNNLYQYTKVRGRREGSFENPNATTNIYNTTANVDQIVNIEGILNIGEDENKTLSLTSKTTYPAVTNIGTANINGGTIASLYNMGELNSTNATYSKLYNLHTVLTGGICIDSYQELQTSVLCEKDIKGTANITGGEVNTNFLLNEYKMTLDSVNVPSSIMNRGDLTVKGSSTITGDGKSAIQNVPFLIKYWIQDNSWYHEGVAGYNYVRTSLTIGDNDGNVNEGPTITTTDSNYAISGDCHPMGTVGMDDFTFKKSEMYNYNAVLNKDYLYKDASGRVSTLATEDNVSGFNEKNFIPVESIEYPNNSDNLCDIKYYDGTIQNTSTSSTMTDVVYIPISDMTDGYDVLYDGAGKVTLDTIDSSARNSVIDVNGTGYKSLQAAISNAPSGATISVTGNYNTANRVTIPQDKALTINYANGVRVNSYSKDSLITNNGSLNVTGTGSTYVVGQTAFENNNSMTFTNGNFNNVFTQSNLVKNKGNLIIDNLVSNGLDIISDTDSEERISMYINNGEFNTNTIYANNTIVHVNGGYFYSGESNGNYEAYYADSVQDLTTAHTKQLFNAHNSIVNFNAFNVDNDSRYNSVSNESNLGRFVDSTLNLNASKFGGKSSKSRIYTTIANQNSKSIVNVNDGEYTNLRFNIIGGGNEYYQNKGTINGSLLVTGSGHKVNVTGGKINTSEDAILIKDGSSIEVTVGTKGDLKPNSDKLNVSKTEPEIRGGNFGITETGSSYAQNNLYFYDGIFKASGDPIDAHIEDVEVGYDVIYDNQKSPKEKYLDMLPLVLNYTTGKYYYDAQEAFDEANTNDQLIWTRNYTNFADTPSLVIAQDKKFSLYFSYGTATNRPIYYGYYLDNPSADPLNTTARDEFEPYDGTGSFSVAGMSAGVNRVKINNISYIDENTGEEIERPFIINNGDVTIYGSVTPGAGEDPIFDIMTRTTAIVNNGTMKLSRFSVRNIKANKTIIQNNGDMEIYRGDFISYQSNVITNNGTLNFVGDSNDTPSCYVPTSIKVHSDQSLEDAIDYAEKTFIDIRSILSESIINNANATMNINYLLFDSDYTYTALLNNGTMDVQNTIIETYKGNNFEKAALAGKSIVNNNVMTTNNLQLFTEQGVQNNGTLTTNGGIMDAAYDTVVTNTGIFNMNGGSMMGARQGIVDTGETHIDNAYISTYGEAYHGTGFSESTILGSSINSYGYNTTNYEITYSISTSCSNNSMASRTVSGRPYLDTDKEFPEGYYKINNAVIYIGPGKPLKLGKNASGNTPYVGLDSSMKIEQFCDYAWDNNYNRYYHCDAPYAHEGEGGANYTVAAIESNRGIITMEAGSVHHGSDNNYKYAINMYTDNSYLGGGSFTQTGGYVSKLYNGIGTVTMGTKDNAFDGSMHIASASCSNKAENVFNLYDGSVFMNQDKLCHFTDKETNYTIIKPSGGPYSLTNSSNVIVNVEQDEPYSSVREAISHANAGETLMFVNSVSEVTSDFDITVDKNITIDLYGNTLDANLVIDSGTTTITDSYYLEDTSRTKGKLSNITVNNTGTLSITEGSFDKIINKGTANVSSGNIKQIDNSYENATNNPVLTITGGNVDYVNNYEGGTANISNATGKKFINRASDHNKQGIMRVTNSTVERIENYAPFEIGADSEIAYFYNDSGSQNNPIVFTTGTIQQLENGEYIDIDGARVSRLNSEYGVVTVHSGSVGTLINDRFSSTTIYGGAVDYISNKAYDDYSVTINSGSIGSISNDKISVLIILGGETRGISNQGVLTIGTKDGIVNTNSPKITNLNGYALSSSGYQSAVNIYDGYFKSSKTIVIDANIADTEPDYSPYVAPEYDELGVLTGNHIMFLKHADEVDTKIACVQGICYDTLQQAINASVQNYSESEGCPEVKIGDEFYFSVELTEDLVLDPQYSLTINLNYHNINDNGYTIPDNITLRNGSRNGTDLQSNISKLLSNIFGINDNGKDIIITRMEDGNALDTSKTYNLYKYEGSSYELVKVNSDGAGKYVIGRKTTDLKPIKGRIYINDLDSGEYKLVDNYNNELQFTIYDDGTLSPNIKENIVSDFGHMSASSVATLVITIQTGILKINYMLIAISIIAVLSIMFVLKRKSDANN